MPMTSLARLLRRAAAGAALALAAAAGHADTPPDDGKRALDEFIVAYRLAEVWPRMVPRIARDSLPRLEQAVRARIDADTTLRAETRAAAQERVAQLLDHGRVELEAALRAMDADELAAYAAFSIYARYFQTAEIREITAFFDSATGRKLTQLGPVIVAETRAAGGADVLPRHFDAQELAQIQAFWDSPVGRKMNATAGQVRDDMHAHFVDRSEPAVQAVASRLALEAEAGGKRPGEGPADAASAPAAP